VNGQNLKEPPMGRIGLPEMLVILAIVIIIFGANRLPQLGRGIGGAIKNFKEGIKSEDETTADHKP
jgi:sec-independent protein translocase protein TatA